MGAARYFFAFGNLDFIGLVELFLVVLLVVHPAMVVGMFFVSGLVGFDFLRRWLLLFVVGIACFDCVAGLLHFLVAQFFVLLLLFALMLLVGGFGSRFSIGRLELTRCVVVEAVLNMASYGPWARGCAELPLACS